MIESYKLLPSAVIFLKGILLTVPFRLQLYLLALFKKPGTNISLAKEECNSNTKQ